MLYPEYKKAGVDVKEKLETVGQKLERAIKRAILRGFGAYRGKGVYEGSPITASQLQAVLIRHGERGKELANKALDKLIKSRGEVAAAEADPEKKEALQKFVFHLAVQKAQLNS